MQYKRLVRIISRNNSRLMVGEQMQKRIYLLDERGEKKSYWHDIDLYEDEQTLRMIVEIGYGSISKMELSRDEKYNPIK